MWLVILAILFLSVSGAGQTAPPCTYLADQIKPDDPFQFTMAFLDSLSYAKAAFRPPNKLLADADATSQLSDLIFRVKAAGLDYACAAESLIGYQKSQDRSISLAALTAVLIYQNQSEMSDESVALFKSMAIQGADRRGQGDLAEKMADLRLRRDKEWSDLPMATVGVTHALVSNVPDAKGKLSSLVITTQQRRAVIQKLEKDFGSAVKENVKEDQDPFLFSAKVLYAWISNKGWASSDQK